MPQTLKEKLAHYLDASYPILYIDTYEESKTDNIIKSVIANRKAIKWNGAQGLIAGVLGCSKSLTAKVTAALFDVPLLRLDMGKILEKYVGESEENMRRAIALAEAIAPCVLWVDELEKAFVGMNGDG